MRRSITIDPNAVRARIKKCILFNRLPSLSADNTRATRQPLHQILRQHATATSSIRQSIRTTKESQDQQPARHPPDRHRNQQPKHARKSKKPRISDKMRHSKQARRHQCPQYVWPPECISDVLQKGTLVGINAARQSARAATLCGFATMIGVRSRS